jgi:hypothetical protein
LPKKLDSLSQLGAESLGEIIGKTDLLRTSSNVQDIASHSLDLSHLIYQAKPYEKETADTSIQVSLDLSEVLGPETH